MELQTTEAQVQEIETQEAAMPSVDVDKPLTSQERQEIKLLSKVFLGSSSKWQKLAERGTPMPVRDMEGNLVIVAYTNKVMNAINEPSAVYLNQVVRTTPREILRQLREMLNDARSTRETKLKQQEAEKAALEASGTLGDTVADSQVLQPTLGASLEASE